MLALRSLVSLIGQKRDYLTLLLVAGTAAGLYAAFASIKAERDNLRAAAERICASAGADFKVGRGRLGEVCARKVQELVAFKSDAQAATAERLIAAMRERERKDTEDARRRAVAHKAARAAAAAMNTAEEEIHDDQVTGNWFAALNSVAGLRPPGS